MLRRHGLWLALVLCGAAPLSAADSTAELIRVIRTVGPKGEHQTEVIGAAKALRQAGPDQLVPILKGFKDANPLAENWLRGAFEAVADRTLKTKDALPAKELEAFVRDRSQPADARRLAYEWLLKVDASAEDRLIPGMLKDPAADFRRDAVARLLDEATKKSGPDKLVLYKEALTGATDEDQVGEIVKPLRDAGEKVDLQKHFGYLADWEYIGPFDNTKREGFARVYPPETDQLGKGPYPGRLGEVEWHALHTDEENGQVDLMKQLVPTSESVAYLRTTYESPAAGPVEFRLMCQNAWKLWVNGELVFEREEYHRGITFDQYRIPVTLKAGRNDIFVKLCQNEQTEDWAQVWLIRLRVTDASGAARLPVTAQK